MQSLIIFWDRIDRMNARRALSDIREIGDTLARAQHTSCFRAAPIALTAIIAFAFAMLPGVCIEPMAAGQSFFVYYWLGIAILNLLIVCVDLGVRYLKTDSELQRGKTRNSLYQFTPCVFIGAYSTLTLLPLGRHSDSLLPGLWCVLMSLGIFATVNNAPKAMVFPAAFYAIAGGLFWRFEEWTVELGAWSMGLSFGIGQAWMALVLWRGPHDD